MGATTRTHVRTQAFEAQAWAITGVVDVALLRRDVERRAWLAHSFRAEVPACGELETLEDIRKRYAELCLVPIGRTTSGLPGRAFFAAHIDAILQEEPAPSEFALGFVRIHEGRDVDVSVMRPVAQMVRETLNPEDHLAEVRPTVLGVLAPGTTGAELEERLAAAALSIASTTFFDAKAGCSRCYEAEVAMSRLDGRRTVEDVFREAQRCKIHRPEAIRSNLARAALRSERALRSD